MFCVALRKESVDRNCGGACARLSALSSLSARRAWIEIIDDFDPSSTRKVALRKESVDRNISVLESYNIIVKSLSARRAWIEIKKIGRLLVAVWRRSPQGERG